MSDKPVRKWTPSGQALQNIASAADVAAKRVRWADTTLAGQPVFVVSSAWMAKLRVIDLPPVEVADGVEKFLFFNLAARWVFEGVDFLQQSAYRQVFLLVRLAKSLIWVSRATVMSILL